MTRIESTFATLKAQNKKALIPYVMAGDPNPTTTVDLLHDNSYCNKWYFLV